MPGRPPGRGGRADGPGVDEPARLTSRLGLRWLGLRRLGPTRLGPARLGLALPVVAEGERTPERLVAAVSAAPEEGQMARTKGTKRSAKPLQ